MLDHGADPNVTRRFGQRLMHDVSALGAIWGRPVMWSEERQEFARLLLDAGARLDVRDDMLESTPLGWACRWGRVELVELLLERGAPVHEPETKPWATPLAWASKMGHESIVRRLRDAGAER